jgi:hypothetical protein
VGHQPSPVPPRPRAARRPLPDAMVPQPKPGPPVMSRYRHAHPGFLPAAWSNTSEWFTAITSELVLVRCHIHRINPPTETRFSNKND